VAGFHCAHAGRDYRAGEERNLAAGDGRRGRPGVHVTVEGGGIMTGYIARRYGTNANRKWWGMAARKVRINNGKYIKTSNPNAPRVVGEDGPELVKLRDTGSN